MLTRLVDKIDLCRRNDGKLSRSISVMMQNMAVGGADGKGRKGKRKAALFKSLELQKKSRDLYAHSTYAHAHLLACAFTLDAQTDEGCCDNTSRYMDASLTHSLTHSLTTV